MSFVTFYNVVEYSFLIPPWLYLLELYLAFYFLGLCLIVMFWLLQTLYFFVQGWIHVACIYSYYFGWGDTNSLLFFFQTSHPELFRELSDLWEEVEATRIRKYFLVVRLFLFLIRKSFQVVALGLIRLFVQPLTQSFWQTVSSYIKNGKKQFIRRLKLVCLFWLKTYQKIILLPYIFVELRERSVFKLYYWSANVFYYFCPHIGGLLCVLTTLRQLRQQSPITLLKSIRYAVADWIMAGRSIGLFLLSASVVRLEDANIPRYVEIGYPLSWVDPSVLYRAMYQQDGFFFWTLKRDFDQQVFLNIKEHYRLPLYLDSEYSSSKPPQDLEPFIASLRQSLIDYKKTEKIPIFDGVVEDAYQFFFDNLRLTILEELKYDPLIVLRLCMADYQNVMSRNPFNAYMYDYGILERLFINWHLVPSSVSKTTNVIVTNQKVEQFFVPTQDQNDLFRLLEQRGYFQFFHDDWTYWLLEFYVEMFLVALPYEFVWGKAIILHGMFLPLFVLWAKPVIATSPPLFVILGLTGILYVRHTIKGVSDEFFNLYKDEWFAYRLAFLKRRGFDPDPDEEDIELALWFFIWLLIPAYLDRYRGPYLRSPGADIIGADINYRRLVRLNRGRHQGDFDYFLDRLNEDTSPITFFQNFWLDNNYRYIMAYHGLPAMRHNDRYFFVAPHNYLFEVEWLIMRLEDSMVELEDTLDAGDVGHFIRDWEEALVFADYQLLNPNLDQKQVHTQAQRLKHVNTPMPRVGTKNTNTSYFMPRGLYGGITSHDPHTGKTMPYGFKVPPYAKMRDADLLTIPFFEKHREFHEKKPPIDYKWNTYWTNSVDLNFSLLRQNVRPNVEFSERVLKRDYYPNYLRARIYKFFSDAEWLYVYNQYEREVEFGRLSPFSVKPRNVKAWTLPREKVLGYKWWQMYGFDASEVDAISNLFDPKFLEEMQTQVDLAIGPETNYFMHHTRLDLQRYALWEALRFSNDFFNPIDEGLDRNPGTNNEDIGYSEQYPDVFIAKNFAEKDPLPPSEEVFIKQWMNLLRVADTKKSNVLGLDDWLVLFHDADEVRDSGVAALEYHDMLGYPTSELSLVRAELKKHRLRPLTHNEIVGILRSRLTHSLPVKLGDAEKSGARNQFTFSLAHHYLDRYSDASCSFSEILMRAPRLQYGVARTGLNDILADRKLERPLLEFVAWLNIHESDLDRFIHVGEEQLPTIGSIVKHQIVKRQWTFPLYDDPSTEFTVYLEILESTPMMRAEYVRHYQSLLKAVQTNTLEEHPPFVFSDEERNYIEYVKIWQEALLKGVVPGRRLVYLNRPQIPIPDTRDNYLPFVVSDEDTAYGERVQELTTKLTAEMSQLLEKWRSRPPKTLTGYQQSVLRRLELLQLEGFTGNMSIFDVNGLMDFEDIVPPPPPPLVEKKADAEVDHHERIMKRQEGLERLHKVITGRLKVKSRTHVAPLHTNYSKQTYLNYIGSGFRYPVYFENPNEINFGRYPFLLYKCYKEEIIPLTHPVPYGLQELEVPVAGDVIFIPVERPSLPLDPQLQAALSEYYKSLMVWRERVNTTTRPLEAREVAILNEFLNVLVMSPTDRSAILQKLGLEDIPEWVQMSYADDEEVQINAVAESTPNPNRIAPTRSEIREHTDALAMRQVEYRRALRLVKEFETCLNDGYLSELLGGEDRSGENNVFINNVLGVFDDQLTTPERVLLPDDFLCEDVDTFVSKPIVIPKILQDYSQNFLWGLTESSTFYDSREWMDLAWPYQWLTAPPKKPDLFRVPKVNDQRVKDQRDLTITEGTEFATIFSDEFHQDLSRKSSEVLLTQTEAADLVIRPVLDAVYISPQQIAVLNEYVRGFCDFRHHADELKIRRFRELQRGLITTDEVDQAYHYLNEYLRFGTRHKRTGPPGKLQSLHVYSQFVWDRIPVYDDRAVAPLSEDIFFSEQELNSYLDAEAYEYVEPDFEDIEDAPDRANDSYDGDEDVLWRLIGTREIWTCPTTKYPRNYLRDQYMLVGSFQATQQMSSDYAYLLQLTSLFTPVDIYGIYIENSLAYSPLRWFDVYDATTQTVFEVAPNLDFEFKDGLYLQRNVGYKRSTKLRQNITSDLALVDNIETITTGFAELEKIAGLEYAVFYYTYTYFGITPGQLLEMALYSSYWASNWLQAIYHASFLDASLPYEHHHVVPFKQTTPIPEPKRIVGDVVSEAQEETYETFLSKHASPRSDDGSPRLTEADVRPHRQWIDFYTSWLIRDPIQREIADKLAGREVARVDLMPFKWAEYQMKHYLNLAGVEYELPGWVNPTPPVTFSPNPDHPYSDVPSPAGVEIEMSAAERAFVASRTFDFDFPSFTDPRFTADSRAMRENTSRTFDFELIPDPYPAAIPPTAIRRPPTPINPTTRDFTPPTEFIEAEYHVVTPEIMEVVNGRVVRALTASQRQMVGRQYSDGFVIQLNDYNEPIVYDRQGVPLMIGPAGREQVVYIDRHGRIRAEGWMVGDREIAVDSEGRHVLGIDGRPVVVKANGQAYRIEMRNNRGFLVAPERAARYVPYIPEREERKQAVETPRTPPTATVSMRDFMPGFMTTPSASTQSDTPMISIRDIMPSFMATRSASIDTFADLLNATNVLAARSIDVMPEHERPLFMGGDIPSDYTLQRSREPRGNRPIVILGPGNELSTIIGIDNKPIMLREMRSVTVDGKTWTVRDLETLARNEIASVRHLYDPETMSRPRLVPTLGTDNTSRPDSRPVGTDNTSRPDNRPVAFGANTEVVYTPIETFRPIYINVHGERLPMGDFDDDVPIHVIGVEPRVLLPNGQDIRQGRPVIMVSDNYKPVMVFGIGPENKKIWLKNTESIVIEGKLVRVAQLGDPLRMLAEFKTPSLLELFRKPKKPKPS